MTSSRNTVRQLFGLTLTLVGLLSWNTLPATEYQLRFSNIVTRSNNDCAPYARRWPERASTA